MMFTPSNRVKLNRTRLKDVACLKSVPRRRASQLPADVNQQNVAQTPFLGEKVDAIVNSNGDFCQGTSGGSQPGRRRVRDVDRTVNPISTSLAGSEISLKRHSQASSCSICGDCKYISPQRRTTVKQVAKSFDPRPEETSKEIVRLDRYPKVTLCDVLLNSNARGHCCGFLLRDLLKTETVRCFKQGTTTDGFQLEPCCDEWRNNSVPCPGWQSAANRRQPREYTKKAAFINHAACRSLKGRESDVSPTTFLTENATVAHSKGGTFATERHQGKINLDSLIKEAHTCSQSCPEPTVGTCNPEEPCQKKTAREGPGLLSDNPASFTCQRVRVHIGKTHYSCARTDMPWPLSDIGPTLSTHEPANKRWLSTMQHESLGSLRCQSSDIHQEAHLAEGVGHKSSYEIETVLSDVKDSTVGLPSVFTTFSTTSQLLDSGTDILSVPPPSSSNSLTPSPAELCLSDWQTSPPMFASSPIPSGVWSWGSSPSVLACTPDTQSSHQSSLLLCQEMGNNGRSTPLNGVTPPARDNKSDEECEGSILSEVLLPPLLSPFGSPQTNFPRQSVTLEKDEMSTLLPQVVINGLVNRENCKHDLAQLEVASCDFGSLLDQTPREPSLCNVVDVHNRSDPEASESQGTPSYRPPNGQHSTTEPSSSSSTERLPSSGAAWPCLLDEFTAYQHDILLVDVNQDDTELFENIPQGSPLKLGPARVQINLAAAYGAAQTMKQRSTPVNIKLQCGSPEVNEETISRPWRPQKGSTSPKTQNDTSLLTDKQTKSMGKYDASKNRIIGDQERQQPIQNKSHNVMPPVGTWKNGPWMPNPANRSHLRCQKFASYCRLFFSESQSCGFKMCRFLHVPLEGDEKFCVDTVTRFTSNPMCLHKAGAVFTAYYQNNPPGMFFSMPVFLSLLWGLLKSGMVSDALSVLSVSLAHKIVPTYEFLLALFNLVRESGLTSFVPQLVQLSYKMASANSMLSLDCFECVKNTPEFQQMTNPSTPANQWSCAVSSNVPISEYLNLAHVIEMELCAKQEDWHQMAEVFRSFCTPCRHPNQLERISGHIAVALLSEGKDKMSLPFATFSETICQKEEPGSLVMSFFGRIGVSLMLRYYKTHQWAKGQRVVEVLSLSKVNYSMLKGLFGNEDGGSRCSVITMAAELFLLSGSLEGALNTLRENKWFVSSSVWPCQPADLENRSRVLIHLSKSTSHRDTLEVLCNLPGIQEPIDQVDVLRYLPLFNSHLQVCVDRQVLPVASDTVDFMLSKKILVDHVVLQKLLHKLGKQNHWLRAREIFRNSLTAGYYPAVSAPPGFMSLIVPSRLVEVELALAFEMLITVNASAIHRLSVTAPSTLSITLKRTQESESDYLLAGSRLFSAACIPQPKLIIHYVAVNSSQEQLFTLSIASAQRWLHRNHLWANEVWMH
ncbi:protein TOPAZ1 isoform X2 [Dunckerocampus dactyliophorus]|uniref:protein TOPAZ1 isoform X2 n=1 Tax=Dunckerocampus dactyliophorus TaxID=161453 RepID=UPI0024054E2D|nr:protein TOPAZ1 isoform X2 [Dunckerocampus dactyliophorus]